MVRAHGGEVEAEGQKGRGAVFRIVLPTSPPPGPSLPRLDVRSPLFESLVVFENYPVEESLRKGPGALSITDARAVERPNGGWRQA